MTAHLLQVNIGPVQDFIAAARRSRDLWYGSHILSELSRCVARNIAAGGGELIFPALKKDDSELQECPGPLRPEGHPNAGQPPINVANIVLAKVEGSEEHVHGLAGKVRDKLQEYFKTLAGCVKSHCAGLIAPDIGDAWDEQIETFLEFAAAWVAIGDGPGGYAAARKALARAIAGRKNLRDFEPWKKQRSKNGTGVPKSSLDGARETVLMKPESRSKDAIKTARRYRIASGEQLDAVGLLKRAGGDPGQFVPVINVALGPWLKEAKAAAQNEFDELETACKSVEWRGGKDEVARVTRNLPCATPFPFDASLFLENRLWPTFEERGLLEPADSERPDGLGDKAWAQERERKWRAAVNHWGEKHLAPVWRALSGSTVKPRPFPYAVCLVADGDGMGKAIDTLAQPGADGPASEAHFRFSAELAKFAKEARKIVENEEHLGSLVYSGGDDVLAFLPLSTALACAEALRFKFAQIMKDACASLPESEPRPTLSVGLGVGHVLEGMGDLLDLGRGAETLAKGGSLPEARRRNALAVIADKRSGGTRSWRAQWTGDPVKRLTEDMELLHGLLPTRKVYEIAETLRRLPKPHPKLDKAGEWASILTDEVGRSLSRTEGGKGALTAEEVGLTLGGSYDERHKAVADWIDRLLIAKIFAEGEPRRVAAAEMMEEAAA